MFNRQFSSESTKWDKQEALPSGLMKYLEAKASQVSVD